MLGELWAVVKDHDGKLFQTKGLQGVILVTHIVLHSAETSWYMDQQQGPGQARALPEQQQRSRLTKQLG